MAAATHLYKVKLNLESSAHQPALIEFFKNQGDEVIQTSDGLCLKTSSHLDELKKNLREKELDQGIALETIDPEDENLSPDIKSFIGVS